jgi:hypothetical protein
LQRLATALQQAFSLSNNDASTARPQKRPHTWSEHAQQQQHQRHGQGRVRGISADAASHSSGSSCSQPQPEKA